MPDIKCIEPNCDQIISDPCPNLTLLFGIKTLLHSLHGEITENTKQEEMNNLLEKVNESLKIYEIENEEMHLIEFKAGSVSPGLRTAAPQSKFLILECSKKHRHNYTITCE